MTCSRASFYKKHIVRAGWRSSWLSGGKCLSRVGYCRITAKYCKKKVLTAIVTTVRSAKAVITTFCRMLSCWERETRLVFETGFTVKEMPIFCTAWFLVRYLVFMKSWARCVQTFNDETLEMIWSSPRALHALSSFSFCITFLIFQLRAHSPPLFFCALLKLE